MADLHGDEYHFTSGLDMFDFVGYTYAFAIGLCLIFLFFVQLLKHVVEPVQQI